MKTVEDGTSSLTLAESFAKAASQHLERLKEGEKQVREAGDLEGVHLMRTSCRRLRATVKYLGDHLRRADRKTLQGSLRSLMGALGPVRDLDVMGRAISEAPGIEPSEAAALAASVAEQVAPATARMNEALAGDDYARL